MVSRASSPVSLSGIPAVGDSATRPGMPGRGVRRFAWGLLAYNILVVLWGAVVRATGSGNGCGEHWPLCGDTVVPHWQTWAKLIEFAHRASSGLVIPLLLALGFLIWRSTAPRHLARTFIVAAGFFTFTEALLGAMLVLLGLTGQNHSPLRAVYFGLHLTNTFLLLAAFALAAHFLGRQTAKMRGGVAWRHLLLVGVGLGATIFVGVSGSLAALGDTLYPAHSLREALAQDMGPSGNWLLHLRWVHPTMSFLAGAWLVFLVWRSRRAENPKTRSLGRVLLGLVALQIGLGVADVLTLAPTWLQVTHLLGADLLWVALVVLSARLCAVPLGCSRGGVCGA